MLQILCPQGDAREILGIRNTVAQQVNPEPNGEQSPDPHFPDKIANNTSSLFLSSTSDDDTTVNRD